MSDKRKHIKNPYAQKKRQVVSKPTKLFPHKSKRELAKSDKGLYSNHGKWIHEHLYGKGLCYNEYYDDELDLITTDKGSGLELEFE